MFSSLSEIIFGAQKRHPIPKKVNDVPSDAAMRMRALAAQNIVLNERVQIYEHLIDKSGLLKTMLEIEQMIKKNRAWNGHGDFTYAPFTDSEITNILDLLHSAVDKIHAAHPTNYTEANTGVLSHD